MISTRVMIYYHLLLPHGLYQRIADGGKILEAYAVPLKTLSIRNRGGINEPLSPATMRVSWGTAHVDYVNASAEESIMKKILGLSPAILATCCQIFLEGSYILYTDNEFEFRLQSSADSPSQEVDSNQLHHIASRLYKYAAQHKRWPHCIPPTLINHGLGAFLQ